LNRADLVAFFGISIPQASADIARYAELAPANLMYDRSARVYIASASFRALFATSNTEHYLNDLLALATGVLPSEGSYLGWRPPVSLVESPGRSISADTLIAVLSAIRMKLRLRVRYQSMSRPEPTWRELSPHAMANDGFRWHVRAYCHERSEFRDFLIARMLDVQIGEATDARGEDDLAWTDFVRVVIAPNPRLSISKQKVIELDYGMVGGEAVLKCRRALLYYVIRRLGLNADGPATPEAQQIALKNRREIAAYLDATETRSAS
jgi:predicted DNA-binding transcriptional regulator YafY